IAALALLLGCGTAHAGWIEGETATIQALDKITARISTIKVPINEPARFGTLSLVVRRCAYHPPEEPPEDAAFIEVVDNGHDAGKPPRPVFNGWMFASSPAVSAMEHPVYDLTLLSCKPD
ncbi:MAG: DUF2155 domain-containing protein, partial [Pseudomonadota bacterium]|nr:DUF2155 domain-containing protein [Pseudomonadota bacterium]